MSQNQFRFLPIIMGNKDKLPIKQTDKLTKRHRNRQLDPQTNRNNKAQTDRHTDKDYHRWLEPE